MGAILKDFVKNIGGIAKDAALAGITKGLRESQLNALFGFSDSEGNNNTFSMDVTGVDYDDNFSLYNIPLSTNYNGETYEGVHVRNSFNDFNHVKQNENQQINITKNYSSNVEDIAPEEYSLRLPLWNYHDFINERNIFIKHLSNGFDEPGWFYFKLFFDFSSNHGLFGGIMNSIGGDKFISTNSATDYLYQCKEIFKYEKLEERMICLQRFTRLLSYININAPWFFKSIKNLSSVSNPKLDSTNPDEQYIEIELDQDAVDMRISTLLSLYKYVCYDDINNKEILPENLRKFDMCIFIFSSPIKFIHNSVKNPKALYSNDQSKSSNTMSFKLYKFLNCEIDPTTLGGYMNGDMKNEQPFALGQNTLKIKYDRVYEYNMNEYMGFMFGSDGIYLDNPQIDVKDINNLTTLSEDYIHNNIATILKGNSRFVLGNIYGQNKQIYERFLSNSKNAKIFTDYAQAKYGLMSNNKNFILNTGYDILYKLLGTGYNANAEVLRVGKEVIGDGTVLNGHGDYRVGSAVWRSKMRRLSLGNTNLSYREKRLVTVGKGLNTNWMQNLHDMALNRVKPFNTLMK